jgi:hypothetical protein
MVMFTCGRRDVVEEESSAGEELLKNAYEFTNAASAGRRETMTRTMELFKHRGSEALKNRRPR